MDKFRTTTCKDSTPTKIDVWYHTDAKSPRPGFQTCELMIITILEENHHDSILRGRADVRLLEAAVSVQAEVLKYVFFSFTHKDNKINNRVSFFLKQL